jgi:hypothetical protein
MANRSIAAKRRKLQKHISALPRVITFDTPGTFVKWEGTKFPDRLKAERVSAPGGMNREVMLTLKNGAKSLGVSMGEIDEMILRTYGRLFIGTPAGKAEVRDAIMRLRKEKVENKFVQLRDNAYERVRLYYREDRTKFILVRDDKRRLVIQISLPYPDKSLALRAWQLERVRWVSKTSSVAPPEA